MSFNINKNEIFTTLLFYVHQKQCYPTMFSSSTCSELDVHEVEYAFDVHADIAFVVLVGIVAAVVVAVVNYIDIQVLDIVHQCIVVVPVILQRNLL